MPTVTASSRGSATVSRFCGGCVIRPSRLHISRRLTRTFRQSDFEVRINTAFHAVIDACSKDRPGQDGTWITPEMRLAYAALHRDGWAHSVEIWQDDELAGGLYGLAIDRVFFGESMFSSASNASKAAMLALCSILERAGFRLLDCQVESPHLVSLGAEMIPRTEFARELAASCHAMTPFHDWPPQARKINEFLPPGPRRALQ